MFSVVDGCVFVHCVSLVGCGCYRGVWQQSVYCEMGGGAPPPPPPITGDYLISSAVMLFCGSGLLLVKESDDGWDDDVVEGDGFVDGSAVVGFYLVVDGDVY